MGIVDFVRRFTEKKGETKKKFKEAQEDLRIQQMLEERQKSSNKRELEKYMKDQEEAEIKKQLDIIHKKQTQDAWSGKNGILNEKTTILKDDRPILKEKNIFTGVHNQIPLGGNNMFFKF